MMMSHFLKKCSILFLLISIILPQNVLSVEIEEDNPSTTKIIVIKTNDAIEEETPSLWTLCVRGIEAAASYLTSSEKPKKPKQRSLSAKALVWGLALFHAPGVMAKDWTSYSDAKAHYSGGGCSSLRVKQISPSVKCLEDGKGLSACHELIPQGVEFDLYEFARHPSQDSKLDPVSITKFGAKKICFYTALVHDGKVTETCFSDLKRPDDRTVKIADMSLVKAHEGLEAGKSISHVAIDPLMRDACGSFRTTQTRNDLGEVPTCLLTALTPEGEVSQLCFDPENPSFLTLKEAKGISLSFEKNGKPVSLIVKDPKALGLKVSADVRDIVVPKTKELQDTEEEIQQNKKKGIKSAMDATITYSFLEVLHMSWEALTLWGKVKNATVTCEAESL
jgi:hypothetical protein